jgi:hypothetical protein
LNGDATAQRERQYGQSATSVGSRSVDQAAKFTIADRTFTIRSRIGSTISSVLAASPPRQDHLLHTKVPTMTKPNEIVRIDLTTTQKQTVKKETGKDVEAIELTVKELEERIAPVIIN